ncbi:unnamed protein product, partial [Hapterophycus canaliculatus]
DEEEGFDDAVDDVSYTVYRPKKLDIGVPHPDPVVENTSMAAVDPPELWYNLKLQELEGEHDVVKSGKLSALQLEAISYACQAHETRLPDGSRAGFFIGDGAGVGKGRQLAGIMLENFLHGRRKHVWISVGNDLAFDARRDLDDLGCGRPHSDDEDSSSSSSSEEEEEEEADDEETESETETELEGEAEGGGGGGGRGRQRKREARRQAAIAADGRLKKAGDNEKKTREQREDRVEEKEEKARRGGVVGGGRVGGVFIDSFQQNKHAYGTIRDGDGVMFLTYSSLVAANRDGKSRLKQACRGKSF